MLTAVSKVRSLSCWSSSEPAIIVRARGLTVRRVIGGNPERSNRHACGDQCRGRGLFVSKAVTFEEIEVGQELGPVETLASERAVRRYCEDWDDRNPLYLEDSPFGGPVVPPAFMAGLTGFQLLATRYDARATIGAKTEHQNIHPAAVGKRLITRGRIADKYLKRGLEYVVIESSTVDEDGVEIRRSRDHILLGIERRK